MNIYPNQLHVEWYQLFLEGKERPEREADPSSPSSAVVKKE